MVKINNESIRVRLLIIMQMDIKIINPIMLKAVALAIVQLETFIILRIGIMFLLFFLVAHILLENWL